MKLLFDNVMQDLQAGARFQQRVAEESFADKRAWEQLKLAQATNASVISHAINAGLILAGQTGTTEQQQTVSPSRTATGDAIVGAEGVAASGVAVSAQAVATSLGNLASALVPIVTAAGGIVTAQTLAALLPVVVNSVGGASTPSQTQPKPTA
jgi:hypothetical protein